MILNQPMTFAQTFKKGIFDSILIIILVLKSKGWKEHYDEMQLIGSIIYNLYADRVFDAYINYYHHT
jgi:hypothetical protein